MREVRPQVGDGDARCEEVREMQESLLGRAAEEVDSSRAGSWQGERATGYSSVGRPRSR